MTEFGLLLAGKSASFTGWNIEAELINDEINDGIRMAQLRLFEAGCFTFLDLFGDASVDDMKSCIAKPGRRSPALIIVLKGLFSEVYPRGDGIGFVIQDAEPSVMLANSIDRLKPARYSTENFHGSPFEHASISKPAIP